MSKTEPPKIVQQLIDLIGISETLVLMKHYGGLDFKFPSTHRVGRFHKILKPESVSKIVDYFGGERIDYLPKLTKLLTRERNIEVHTRSEAGQSNYQIARDLDLSRRMVQFILKKPKPEPEPAITQQLSLF